MEDTIEERIISAYPDASVKVALSGRNAEIKISSVTLSALSRVQQQKKIYACIDDLISEGVIHAVSIKIAK
jgi:acid stress-induced BolA-like protein IbaG/YrbA